jgi:hypothetical protein
VDVGVELDEPGGSSALTVPRATALLPSSSVFCQREDDAAALAQVELREREPLRDLVRLGERAPDALDRMAEPALEADAPGGRRALEGSVGHRSSCGRDVVRAHRAGRPRARR